MRDKILRHIHDARKLESLYRGDKTGFRNAFLDSFAEMPAGTVKDFWLARLKPEKSEILSWGNSKDLLLVLLAALAGGLVLKIPVFFTLQEDNFFARNLTFAFVPALLLFFGKWSKIKRGPLLWAFGFIAASALYINILPAPVESRDSVWLACLHLPVISWLLLGFVASGGDRKKPEHELEFISFSAELLVMSALVMVAAGLFTAILLGMFQAIGYQIRQLYFDWFGIFGLGAIPVLAALILKENPGLLKQVAPVVAGIFSPLALLALLIFLPALLLSGRNLYTDREFLLVFNLLLLGVLALIFFSLSEITQNPGRKFNLIVLLFLSLLTLVVNSLAVSAILYRILRLGITPNRVAVLGSNLLILTNLVLVGLTLFRYRNNPEHAGKAGKNIAAFLPVYGIWALAVLFLFPLLFGFQ